MCEHTALIPSELGIIHASSPMIVSLVKSFEEMGGYRGLGSEFYCIRGIGRFLLGVIKSFASR